MRGAFCLECKSETTGDSSHWSWIELKAEAARLEQEEVGTPDSEAPFASNEGVKRPTVLAAGAG
ncbi:hypothetical protein DN409_26045 [Bacillus mycoides]|nr:hypothetical protein DN409_26045 [Bacillus mycoides]